MKTLCIIQARMGATRLPSKMMKKICGKPIIDYVLERVKLSKKIDEIILATTNSPKDDVIEEYALKKRLSYFRGSDEDVLSRYYHAAKKFYGNLIVRITGDNPLIDPVIVDQVIDFHVRNNVNYTSNNLMKTYPLGLDVEVFDFETLEKAFKSATEKFEREHVTPYIYKHPEIFELQNIEAKEKLKRPDIRITVDTEEDYDLIRRIICNFNNINFKAEEIIDFLDSNPKLILINKHIKQKEL